MMRNAVVYVHARTVEGMNAGKSVYELMNEIHQPQELWVSEGHGKIAWSVRGIFEDYAGWFHFDSTAELYAVPPGAVYGDVIDLMGGSDKLVQRASHYVDMDQPEKALRLLEIALASEGDNRQALQVKARALRELLRKAINDDPVDVEIVWLKAEIDATQRLLEPSQ